MPQLACPHCGARNFADAGWADVEHCNRCGHALAQRPADPNERAVRELIAARLLPGTRTGGGRT